MNPRDPVLNVPEKVTTEKPDDKTSEEANSYSIEITSRPVTTQVFGDDMSTRQSYATKLEIDGNIFEEMGSGSIPDDSNENASITATAHDLSTSEVVLLIGVSFASFLVILSAFIILAITLVAVMRYVCVPDCHHDYQSDSLTIVSNLLSLISISL